MTTKLQKLIAITCLVSLIIASVALAENEPPRRGGRGPQMQGDGAGGYRGGRGTDQGGPGRGMGMEAGGGMMGGRGMGMGPGGGMQAELIPQMILRRLNLTEEQNKKLKTLEQQQMEKSEQLSKLHLDLRNKLDGAIDKSDKEAIAKIAQDMGKNIAETALLQVSGKESLKEILTEDQLKMVEKFNQQRAEMREKMRKQMEQRMQGRGPGQGQGQGRGQGQGQGQGRGRGRQNQDQNRRERPR